MKAGWALILLALLLPAGGCTLVGQPPLAAKPSASWSTPPNLASSLAGKPTVEGASTLSYFPYRTAAQPTVPTPYQAENCFYGYHDTCWRSWPHYWMPCSGAKPEGGIVEMAPPPAGELIPAPRPEPYEMAVPGQMGPQ